MLESLVFVCVLFLVFFIGGWSLWFGFRGCSIELDFFGSRLLVFRVGDLDLGVTFDVDPAPRIRRRVRLGIPVLPTPLLLLI